jgi:hydroxymethylpyrimidine/phosphomethylpyrimidine kinase
MITALTVQDTRNVTRVEAIPASLLIEQARTVLADMPVDAFKIGLIGSVEIASALHTLLIDHPHVPLVLDPVLAAGGGTPLASAELVAAIRTLLLPITTVATPNSREARTLAPNADTLDACAQELMSLGCEFVLVTGAHEPGVEVVNNFYGHRRLLDSLAWPRLPHDYHGSGCTLAASLAGLIAQGLEPLAAVHEAQQYTWECLRHGYRIGHGQHLPNRLFWAGTTRRGRG